MPENCRITTIENYEKRIPVAKNNFKRAGKEEVITLLEGDAMDILKELDGTYDFIFLFRMPEINLAQRSISMEIVHRESIILFLVAEA